MKENIFPRINVALTTVLPTYDHSRLKPIRGGPFRRVAFLDQSIPDLQSNQEEGEEVVA